MCKLFYITTLSAEWRMNNVWWQECIIWIKRLNNFPDRARAQNERKMIKKLLNNCDDNEKYTFK